MFNNGISKADQMASEGIGEDLFGSSIVQDADEPKIGIVVNCLNLNIRSEPEPDAEVLCVVQCLTELMVESVQSNDEFYKVYTASGVEGFCMKKYIEIRK